MGGGGGIGGHPAQTQGSGLDPLGFCPSKIQRVVLLYVHVSIMSEPSQLWPHVNAVGCAWLQADDWDFPDGEEEFNDGEEEYTDGEEEFDDGEEEFDDGEEVFSDAEEEVIDVEEEFTDGEVEVIDLAGEVTDGEAGVSDVEEEVSDAEQEVTEVEEEVIDGEVTQVLQENARPLKRSLEASQALHPVSRAREMRLPLLQLTPINSE